MFMLFMLMLKDDLFCLLKKLALFSSKNLGSFKDKKTVLNFIVFYSIK